jgi:hypothetical protein
MGKKSRREAKIEQRVHHHANLTSFSGPQTGYALGRTSAGMGMPNSRHHQRPLVRKARVRLQQTRGPYYQLASHDTVCFRISPLLSMGWRSSCESRPLSDWPGLIMDATRSPSSRACVCRCTGVDHYPREHCGGWGGHRANPPYSTGYTSQCTFEFILPPSRVNPLSWCLQFSRITLVQPCHEFTWWVGERFPLGGPVVVDLTYKQSTQRVDQ